MRWIRWCALMMLAVNAPRLAVSEEVNWQEAVARLTRERTIAENCAALLKKNGDKAALDSGSLSYADAKGEFDGVIGGLVVALARKRQPESLPDLQARLKRGFDKREAFCISVKPLVLGPQGQKSPIADIVSGAVKPLTDAVVAIWSKSRDDDALMRKTIQTQLEAASWVPFDKVSPSF